MSKRNRRRNRQRRPPRNAAPEVATPIATAGDYEATQTSRLRSAPRISLRGEDDHLAQRDRDKLQTATMDQRRNFAVLAWAIRKHCDFVADHNFQPNTGDKTLNDDLAGIVADWSTPEEFDERQKFGLHEHVRTNEALRTIAGDILIEKLTNGRVQAIEADRIRDPDRPNNKRGDTWKNGVLQNAAGKNISYAVHRRDGNGFTFEKILPAEKVYHFGYFQRHDQARGITEISAAINDFRDVATAKTYALAKMKISQLFGLVLNVEDPTGEEISLADGPFVAELGQNDKAQFLTDATPSTQFDAFMRHVIGISLKSLDLPFNFYDEAHTNFFGSRAACILYLMACKPKRRGVQQKLTHLTRWRFHYETARGKLRLPRNQSVENLKFAWHPAGMTWFDPSKEATAAEKLISLNLASRAEIRLATHGDDWFALTEQIAREQAHLRDLGLAEDPTAPASQSGKRPTVDDLAAELIDQMNNQGNLPPWR